MKSFLVRGKKPILKWGSLNEGTFFEGKVPPGFSLAISPSDNYIVIDVDRHGDIDGFDNIPENLKNSLNKTLNYKTKNNGKHYWFRYTGNKKLMNKTSGLGIDLRTSQGYIVWYPKGDIRDRIEEVHNTNPILDSWLESLFGPVNTKK